MTFNRRASVNERAGVRAYLTGELTRLGLTVEARAYNTGTNLVVHLAPTTGADGGPPLIVGGHFDGVSASPAAADNATGAAVAVVAAGYLAGPRVVPIEIVLFDSKRRPGWSAARPSCRAAATRRSTACTTST